MNTMGLQRSGSVPLKKEGEEKKTFWVWVDKWWREFQQEREQRQGSPEVNSFSGYCGDAKPLNLRYHARKLWAYVWESISIEIRSLLLEFQSEEFEIYLRNNVEQWRVLSRGNSWIMWYFLINFYGSYIHNKSKFRDY